jgi:hypothetical protein
VGLVGFQLLEQMPSIIVALDAHLDSAIQRYVPSNCCRSCQFLLCFNPAFLFDKEQSHVVLILSDKGLFWEIRFKQILRVDHS